MSGNRQREIQQLLQELSSLRIQAENIRHQETTVLQELTALIITENPPTNDVATVPIVRATLIEEQENDDIQPVQRARDLRPGDRVRITNSVNNLVGNREPTDRDRLCTVRRVTSARRVLITTDSGINTWRYSTNLAHSPRQNERAGHDISPRHSDE